MTMTANVTNQAPMRARRKRIEPMKAIRAVRALIADKEDTGQVFKIIDALSGGADERMFNKFMATATGKSIVAEKRDLIALLNDRERLSKLPVGTLGRTYYEFMAEENLTADGLVAASKEAPRLYEEMPEGAEIFSNRMRDSHDLWHVTTGYGRDGLGELCLLAFTYAQTRNRGIGFIVLVGARVASKEAPGIGIWKAIREGYRNGKAASWLPAADWEALLEQPLADVRRQLGVATPVTYQQVEPITSAREKDSITGQGMKQAA
ncbi:Coq4 family protein [Parvibaculum sp.]|uniref:Coq4 family protein n=1 Tax=Parvibaculum sp. TaxID=2024848 RepID=UPI002BD0F19C|nr:Coq4 family protein [Parvibaculum sp.]HUD50701.1 Coq4 family protein [Parvibaculum sp.]